MADEADLFAIGDDDDDDLLGLGSMGSMPVPGHSDAAAPAAADGAGINDSGLGDSGAEDELDAIFGDSGDDVGGGGAAGAAAAGAAAPGTADGDVGADDDDVFDLSELGAGLGLSMNTSGGGGGGGGGGDGAVDMSLGELDDLFELGDEDDDTDVLTGAAVSAGVQSTTTTATTAVTGTTTSAAAARAKASTNASSAVRAGAPAVVTARSTPAAGAGAAGAGTGAVGRGTGADGVYEEEMDMGPPPIVSLEVNQTLLQQVTARAEQTLRQELAQDFPDMSVIHQACRLCGVPPDARATVWPWLLSIPQSGRGDPLAAWNGKLDLANQAALRADCEALERSLARRGLSEQLCVSVDEMEQILTLYCRRRAVPYTNTLSKVLVTFAVACASRTAAFNCFYAFCQHLAPALFYEAPPTASSVLTRHRHLRNLVMFFDPALGRHLLTLNRTWWLPDTEAGGDVPADWLASLFATAAAPQALCVVWDAIMAGHTDANGDFACFIAAAVLVRERAALLTHTSGGERLSVTLSSVVSRALVMVDGADKAGVNAVVRLARDMYRTVPPSARLAEPCADDAAADAASDGASDSGSTGGRAGGGRPRAGSGAGRPQERRDRDGAPPQAAASECLIVNAAAAVPQLCLGRKAVKSPSKNQGYTPLRFIVLDCRSVALRSAGRFATAFHVDPASCTNRAGGSGGSVISHASGDSAARDAGVGSSTPRSALTAEGVDLEDCVRQLQSTRGSVYICVMGAGVWQSRGAYRPNVVQRAIELDNAAVINIVRRFQRAGFPYVCAMRDGFSGAYRVMKDSPELGLSALVDFDPERCACSRHDKLVEYLRQQKRARERKSSSGFTVGALLDRINTRRGSTNDGTTRQKRSQSAVSTGSAGATPPRPPTGGGGGAANKPPGVPARGGRRGSAGNLPATSAAAAKASQAAAGARGWFRRMSKTAASTTKRLETKYGAELKQAGNTMSGRMAAWGSSLKERSTELKKSIQRKLEEAEAAGAGGGGGAVAAANGAGAGGGDPSAYAIAGESDTDEDEDELDAEQLAARRHDREVAARAQAKALLHLELAGLAAGADYDLEKWDGTARLFPCKHERKVLGLSSLVSRYLALSRERLLVLDAHKTKLRHGVVRSNHHLTELAKLTFNKSQPKRLVIYFKRTVLVNVAGGSQASATLQPEVFHVDDAKALVQSLMGYIKAFQ